jgi:hypothetical protein
LNEPAKGVMIFFPKGFDIHAGAPGWGHSASIRDKTSLTFFSISSRIFRN